MTLIYVITNLYILFNIYKTRKFLTLIYIVIFLIPIIAYGIPNSFIGGIFGNFVKVSNIAYIFILFFFIIKSIPIKSKVKIWVSIILPVIILSYGYYKGQDITVKKYSLNIEKKSELKKLNAILISDLHLGYSNDEKYLEKVVGEINKLNPDIVFISGDMLDRDYNYIKNPKKAESIFRNINSKYGVYASLGNHDSGKTYDKMLKFFKKSNIKVLKDQKYFLKEEIILIGRKDIKPKGYQGLKRKKIEEIVQYEDYKYPIIVLDHNPTSFSEYNGKEDLILSGHTHNGQVFPLNKLIEKTMENSYGYYINKETGSKMIVSSGIGNRALPIRLGTDVEIVNLNIKFK